MVKRIRIVVAVALLIVAAVAGWQLWAYYHAIEEAEETFSQLRIALPAASGTLAAKERDEEAYERPTVAALQAINSDTIAWLIVEGTHIDYPIMSAPDRKEYYLRKDFYRNYSISGTPFMDERCTLSSQQMILYGHNMKSGTMFADLVKYKDAAYAEEHSTVYLITEEKLRQYEVVAAFETIGRDEGTALFWYKDTEFTETSFSEFSRLLGQYSLLELPQDDPLTCDDHFLTLATCAYHTTDGRFVIVAREVEDTQ